ncbi:MAG: NAD(P)-dependent alcohol dehydrogenase [Pseudomonadota bacterium]|nr:NAD(P)-dependent alcohol dehydrogenase [Pseudomonadota bacterium]
MQVTAYGAKKAGKTVEPLTIERRDLRANDVEIEILYSGICHTDLHQINNDWGMANYPLVPGHEIVGRVTRVGKDVSRFKEGDAAAVGCMVDSCLSCDQCDHGEEQYCREGMTQTYSSEDLISGGYTYGGFSTHIVVREHFVLNVPESMELSKVPPLVCAGITTFSPLKNWGIKEGSRVAVVGIGGLGHMAVQLAVGLGAKVTAITRSEEKGEEAKTFGAHESLLSTDKAAMKAAHSQFDLIIDTVPVNHDLTPYVDLLDVDGAAVIVGHIGSVPEINTGPLVFSRKSISGSLIGGVKQTQEVIDFCAEKSIYPQVEMITPDQINEALERLENSDVHYRFVIDMKAS